MDKRWIGRALLGLSLLLASSGCVVSNGADDEGSGGRGGSSGEAGAGGAEPGASSRPPAGIGQRDLGGLGGAGGAPEQTPDGPTIDDGSRDATRAIQEADIIQIRGTRLYALSAVGGLSIIDVSVRDRLRLLGAYRTTEAKPFEMYVRGDVLIALFKEVQKTDDAGTVSSASQVVALNVRDPAAIQRVGTFDLPGQVSDSRIVGDVLYVVSYESGGCWGCADDPTTTVVSLNIATPSAISEVDRLSFEEKEGTWGWSRSTVSVSADRLYVAGVSSEQASTLQVVDIADPGGDLELGASVEVEGVVSSRWQIDEYQQVLRVISQAPSWDLSKPPVVQTFSVASSSQITPLGRLELVLPRPEELRAARFDGTRAYAITFERTDPLFTIDLTAPEAPVQSGELELPGWIYHMEPRGDRLLALGFDTTNEEGSLNVSLFDVADLAQPTLIERVNFGGTWRAAEVAEDQDRVHKLFNVLDDLGLILVPFSGWSTEVGCDGFYSGIQLVEFTADSLTLRGLAEARGTARRAFLHDERLFSVSEREVQTFDIADLDAPEEKAWLRLSQRVHRNVPVGDRVLRVQSEWWTGEALADVVNVADVESPSNAGYLDLAEAIYGTTTGCAYYDSAPFRAAPGFTFGDHGVLVVEHREPSSGSTVTEVLVIDVSGEVPNIAARLKLDFALAKPELGHNVVQIGSALALLREGRREGENSALEIQLVDLADPLKPRVVGTLERPLAWGQTGLYARGNTLASGYYTSGADDSVHYFLDRVDASRPAAPSASAAVSLPGLLLGPLAERWISVAFDWNEVAEATESYECQYTHGGYWDEEGATCWLTERTLQLLDVTNGQARLAHTQALDPELWLNAVHHGEDRFFLSADQRVSGGRRLVVVADDGGTLAVNELDLGWYGLESPRVSGQSLYFLRGTELQVADASRASAPVLRSVGKLRGSGTDLALAGQRALVALGDLGVQAITLP